MKFVKFKSSLGTIEIIGDQNGIQSIDINEDQIFRETIIPDILKQSVEQILDYIEGSRKSFTFLLNPKGTEFQYKVWNIVKTIPYGKTTSYLKIAKDYGAVCTPDFFGYNKNLELQYRGRIRELKNLKPVIKGDSDLITAMKLIVESGKGPKKQIPSMGCNIKWFN